MPKFTPRPASAVLRISFDERVEVGPREIYWSLKDILAQTGCPACGLVGFDLSLRKAPIINPSEGPFVAVLEGTFE